MTNVPLTDSPGSARTAPATRGRGGSAPAWILTAALCVLHGYAVWVGAEGWAGLTNGWVSWRYDHPLYFHSTLVTRSFLSQSGTTAGYDPAFMAGYPKSVIFPASSTLPELAVYLFGGDRPDLAYKLYVLIAAALIPWLVAAAGWTLRVGAGACLIAVGLFLAYAWSDFPMNYATFGMLPYLLSVPLGLLATGVFYRYAASGRLGWWVATVLLMSATVLVHFTSALIVVPAAAAVYVTTMIRQRMTAGKAFHPRHGLRFHSGVVAIPLAVLLFNAFWWLPGLWLAGTKGPSDFAFVHPEGVIARLVKIAHTEPHIQRWLWVWGILGLVTFWRRERVAAAGLMVFVAAGFGWGYLAGSTRALDFLQPGRHTLAVYTGLSLAGGIGIGNLLLWLRGLTRLPAAVVAAAAIAAVLTLDVGPGVRWGVDDRVLASFPFLASRPSPYLLWVERGLRKHTRPGERVLYEEGGFSIKGEPDPYQSGHYSGLLASRLGVEMIGGPYLHASLTTNFTQFGEGKLFGHAGWNRATFLRYARIYRPDAIVCWTRRARTFCEDNPDLIEVREWDANVLIGRVKGFSGAAVSGLAEVEANPGRLRVTRVEAGVDGTAVLRYHSVPCLRSDPPVAWEPVFLEDDPVPFIRLRPVAGPVTFSVRIPPGPGGPVTSQGPASAGR